LPKWWGDPPAFVVKEVEHYVAEITGDPAEGKSLNFQASGGTVHVALIDGAGVTVREGTNEVSTAGLGAGTYLVRLSAATNGKAGVKVYQLPPKF
jgi:hypothetical protein